jgi:glutamate synthase domain-containing protein 2
MFEIKLSQGAKPGKGGILPGGKVTELIASTRGIPVNRDSISPNRHPEVTDAASLLDLVDRVRRASEKPVGIKFVLGDAIWLDELIAEIRHRGIDSAPDFVTVDSADGGTGAAPQGLMDNMGLPVAFSLPIVHQKLEINGLRERVKVIATGKMINPAGVAAALCLGADVVCSARGFMFALGCIQALQCNKNTCPTGITTHDPKLQKGLNPEVKSTRVANYAKSIQEEVALIAHSCGVLDPSELSSDNAFVINDLGKPERLEVML